MKVEVKSGLKDTSLDGLEFGISRDPIAQAMLHDLLRNKLYSDPINTVVREILSNAIDESKASGVDPSTVVISCPNKIDPHLSITDRGRGINPEKVVKVIRMYLASESRLSDDAIGGYGLGFKSPWSYAESFYVDTTIKNPNLCDPSVPNIKYKYVLYIDSQGAGKIDLVSETLTSNETGTKVSIPVREQDFDHFRNSVDFYTRYLPFKVVGGSEPAKIVHETDDWILTEGNNTRESGVFIVLVGLIPYKVQWSQLRRSAYSYNSDNTYNYLKYLVLKAPVSAVSIPYSRENLQFDEKTVKWCSSNIDKAALGACSFYGGLFSDAEDYIDLCDEVSKTVPHEFRHFIKFKGEYLKLHIDVFYHSVTRYRFDQVGAIESSSKLSQISPSKGDLYIYRDITFGKKEISFIEGYKNVYLISTSDNKGAWSRVHLTNIRFLNVVNASDLMDEIAQNKLARKLSRPKITRGPRVPKDKSVLTAHLITASTCTYNVYKCPSVSITPEEIKNDPKCSVIEIVGWANSSTALENNTTIKSLISYIKGSSNDVGKIYAINSSNIKKVDGATRYKDAVSNFAKNVLSETEFNSEEELVKEYCFRLSVSSLDVSYRFMQFEGSTAYSVLKRICNIEGFKEILSIVDYRKDQSRLNDLINKLDGWNKVRKFNASSHPELLKRKEDLKSTCEEQAEVLESKYFLIVDLFQRGCSVSLGNLKTIVKYIKDLNK